jgi:hypothetical protein
VYQVLTAVSPCARIPPTQRESNRGNPGTSHAFSPLTSQDTPIGCFHPSCEKATKAIAHSSVRHCDDLALPARANKLKGAGDGIPDGRAAATGASTGWGR